MTHVSQQLELWKEHVRLTRAFVLAWIKAKTGRCGPCLRKPERDLFANQDAIGASFAAVYGEAVGAEVARLLREHIAIAAEVLERAWNNVHGETFWERAKVQLENAQAKWLDNAFAIADALAALGVGSRDEMRLMLRSHLAITTTEVVEAVKGNGGASMRAYAEAQKQAAEMARQIAAAMAASSGARALGESPPPAPSGLVPDPLPPHAYCDAGGIYQAKSGLCFYQGQFDMQLFDPGCDGGLVWDKPSRSCVGAPGASPPTPSALCGPNQHLDAYGQCICDDGFVATAGVGGLTCRSIPDQCAHEGASFDASRGGCVGGGVCGGHGVEIWGTGASSMFSCSCDPGYEPDPVTGATCVPTESSAPPAPTPAAASKGFGWGVLAAVGVAAIALGVGVVAVTRER